MSELTAQQGIERTLGQYAQLCDEGRFADFANLFTVDATFHVMGGSRVGRDAIEGFMGKSMTADKRGKHAMVGCVIDVDDDGLHAQAWTDFLFVTKEGRITTSGRYHDQLVKEDDGRWRFAIREIVFVGGSPELAAPVPA